jgi:hypothetical protein
MMREIQRIDSSRIAGFAEEREELLVRRLHP